MRRVIVESPLAGDRAKNERYLKACLLDCLRQGEAPFASHAIYPLVLDDDRPDHRQQGIIAGFAWRRAAHATVVYYDLGISKGMQKGIEDAEMLLDPNHKIEYRKVPGWHE